MPIYEYRCKQCGEIMELERRISERKLPVKCDFCGSKKTEQIISKCDFALTGGGWYATDYKKHGK